MAFWAAARLVVVERTPRVTGRTSRTRTPHGLSAASSQGQGGRLEGFEGLAAGVAVSLRLNQFQGMGASLLRCDVLELYTRRGEAVGGGAGRAGHRVRVG